MQSIWLLTARVGQKLRTFENYNVLRTIYGLVFDNELNCWHRKKNIKREGNKRNDKYTCNNKLYEGTKTLMVWASKANRGNKQS